MSRSGFQYELFTQLARLAKALSNPNRLELLEYLAQGERSVEALANTAGLSVANTSQHLQQLRQVGVVQARREGLRVYYSLAGDHIIQLTACLRRTAQTHLAEMERLISAYLTVKDSLEPVPAEELLERVREGLVTVLDVRPEEEFEAGHLPGAINIPLAELEARLTELPPHQEIVAYCRGPHCVLAYEAVELLRKRGRNVRRLEDGYPEWKAAGLPTKGGR